MKHGDRMPFRQEKIVGVDVAVKNRKYSSSEVKHQADEVCFRTRVNLNLTFSHFQALKERLGMKSNEELACFLLDW